MHVLYRLQAGGTEYGVVKVVNGVSRGPVSCSICSTTTATDVRAQLRSDIRLHECSRRDGNDPSLVWQLFRLFRRERPHIVHTHAWGTLVEGLVAARLARVPVVVHGEHGTLQLKPYQARAQRLAWSKVDRLLSVSSRLAERMAATTGYPLERIQVIRNGVDLARFTAVDRVEARRTLGMPQEVPAIGTAGRLVPVKNQALFIEALGDLARRGAPFVGIIVGDGPLRQALEERALAVGLRDRVRFLGHREDIERVYAALDVFVLSSASEGLSNTILEAMASGLAVVATQVGGADELIEDGTSGILVPPESPDSLASALNRIVCADTPLHALLGHRARQRAEAMFSLEGMIRSYEELYLELASAGLAEPRVARRVSTKEVA